MKRRYSSKLATYLLLATFLVTSSGSLFGYAWCLGVDGHLEVSYSNGSGCCDDGLIELAIEKYTVHTVSQSKQDACGSCLDFSAQYSDAVFFKRVKRLLTLPVATLNAKLYSSRVDKGSVRIARLTSLPPRISQTLLAHRTVVLLN